MTRSAPNRTLEPAHFCGHLLESMAVSEERRKKRKRDTGPDVVGMSIKRILLEGVVRDKPSGAQFEAWLMNRVMDSPTPGPVRAMAIEILADYHNARQDQKFIAWLEAGAPTPHIEGNNRKRRR